jgi:hypothetical protein
LGGEVAPEATGEGGGGVVFFFAEELSKQGDSVADIRKRLVICAL